MRKSNINRLVETLTDAFSRLRLDVPALEAERLGCLIHAAMDSGRRDFHTSSHVLEVCNSLPPLSTLAALFHDFVYFQIDDGFPENMEELLQKFVTIEGGQVAIAEDAVGDSLFDLCMVVFGFRPGQKLSPYQGLNEFLSAFVAVKELESYLTPQQLITIAACIEGTIPFRSDDDGVSCFELLEKRLFEAETQFRLGLSPARIEEIVKDAVVLANQDIANFADEDPGRFLDNTWILLPETNAILWSVNFYSVKNYRQALQKMEAFMNVLDPNSVFHRYKDVPCREEFFKVQKKACYNIGIAREYLGVKLLAIAIVEALAMETGGDAPVSMFLGDIRRKDQQDTIRAEDYLLEMDTYIAADKNKTLLSLFEVGRASESNFDTKHSPLSAFIYKSLGAQRTVESLALAKKMFAEELSPSQFLTTFDTRIVTAIARACAHIAVSRRPALQAFAEKIDGK